MPRPMLWLPLAQAALTVKLMPRRWKMVFRFMVTVEFIDWNMLPEPSMAVSCFSSIICLHSITGFDEESLPKITPTSLFSR